MAFLSGVRGFPHDLPRAALARRRGDAAPLSGLPTFGRLCGTELHLDRRVLRLGCIHHSPCRSSGNVFRSYRFGEVVTVDDPWGNGNSLEWATSCPPPRHNFNPSPYPLRVSGVSRCTTHTWWNGFGLKLTPEGSIPQRAHWRETDPSEPCRPPNYVYAIYVARMTGRSEDTKSP